MTNKRGKHMTDDSDELTAAYMLGLHDGRKSSQRTWVGLTEEEINEVLGGDIRDEPSGELRFIRAIEVKLKEKNT